MAFKYSDGSLAFDSDGFIFKFMDSDGRDDEDSMGVNYYRHTIYSRAQFHPDNDNGSYFGNAVAINSGRVVATSENTFTLSTPGWSGDGDVIFGQISQFRPHSGDEISWNTREWVPALASSANQNERHIQYKTGPGSANFSPRALEIHKGYVINSTYYETSDSLPGRIDARFPYPDEPIGFSVPNYGMITDGGYESGNQAKFNRPYRNTTDNFGYSLAAAHGRFVTYNKDYIDDSAVVGGYGGFYIYSLQFDSDARDEVVHPNPVYLPVENKEYFHVGKQTARLTNQNTYGNNSSSNMVAAGYGVFVHPETDYTAYDNGQGGSIYFWELYLSIYCMFSGELLRKIQIVNTSSDSDYITVRNLVIKYNRIFVQTKREVIILDMNGEVITRHDIWRKSGQTITDARSFCVAGRNFYLHETALGSDRKRIMSYDVYTGDSSYSTGDHRNGGYDVFSKRFLWSHTTNSGAYGTMKAKNGVIVISIPYADDEIRQSSGSPNQGTLEFFRYDEIFDEYVEQMGESEVKIPRGSHVPLR